MAIEIESTTDVDNALASATPFLQQDPAATTVLGSVMAARSQTQVTNDDGSPSGRYWIARESHKPTASQRDEKRAASTVVGVGMRSPVDFMFSFTAANPAVAKAFAQTLSKTEDDLTATSGEALVSAAFSGEWASLRGCPVRVDVSQQLYELGELKEPNQRSGQALSVRLASPDDVPLLCEWFVGFDQETFDHGIEPEPIVRSKLGSLWILEDAGNRCSMAAATPSANGVRRIQSVFTPADHRGKGYGAAVTAAVSSAVVEGGDRAVLFTDLANPIANRIYRRLGYQACGEFTNWSFGSA